MCPKKLSDSDKQEIVELYRNSNQTTSTLATNFDVSSSTISRLLKKSLSDEEYENLIQEKRLSRSNKTSEQLILSLNNSKSDDLQNIKIASEDNISEKTKSNSSIELEINNQDSQDEDDNNASNIIRRRRRRSSSINSKSSTSKILEDTNISSSDEEEEEIKLKKIKLKDNQDYDDDDDDDTMSHETVLALQEFLGEELEDPDDDDNDDDDDDDDNDDNNKIILNSLPERNLSVFPLEEASLHKTCYIVVDRSGELITRPLQDFRELGKIPDDEFSQKTLPIFENHRVARRFSKRRERVIKIPNGILLKKTSSYLASKGIKRILLDGQVYSLSI